MIAFDETAQVLYRAFMWAGSWWCHQLPARTPHLWGVQLPLCWRCTGILAGALLLLGWLLWRRRVPSLLLSLALALPLPLDVLHAILTHTDGDNARRLLTGVLWGIFGTSLFLHLIRRAALFASSRTRTPAATLPNTSAT
ncbi:MAG TPA: DUF2085 domain-containing protein [Pyrinomonadaceae bacterium]|nr:DUF2085 domain-containing protein [Pyrinomonadaceae bacterium]